MAKKDRIRELQKQAQEIRRNRSKAASSSETGEEPVNSAPENNGERDAPPEKTGEADTSSPRADESSQAESAVESTDPGAARKADDSEEPEESRRSEPAGAAAQKASPRDTAQQAARALATTKQKRRRSERPHDEGRSKGINAAYLLIVLLVLNVLLIAITAASRNSTNARMASLEQRIKRQDVFLEELSSQIARTAMYARVKIMRTPEGDVKGVILREMEPGKISNSFRTVDLKPKQ